MIFDLAQSEHSVRESVDFCVIGAGIAGLLLANKLRARGAHVLVLESGAREQTDETHPLNEVIQLNTPYRGAMHGRARCLGGTSTRWGGALIPFLAEDLMARPYLDLAEWPVALSEINRYIAEIETLFHVDNGPFDDEFVDWIGARKFVPHNDPDFLARFAKWPTFRHRNVASLLGDRISTDTDLKIWLNATVQKFVVQSDARALKAIVARHPGGKKITVSATHFVLCAGALESTRLLLWLDRSHGNAIFRDCQALGRYFYDHVSTVAADLDVQQVDRLNRLAGFRFVGSTMRSLRYELSPSAQKREGVGSAFGHIVFRTESETGFDALRELLRALQRNGHIDTRYFLKIANNLPYFATAVFWRLAYKQLYWPRPAAYELHIVAEQLPYFDNRIVLGDRADSLGMPLAAVDWRPHQLESDTIAAYARQFNGFWRRHGLENVARLDWRFDLKSPKIDLSCGHDIFHPAGSTRMGRDGRSAVVDGNLKTFAISNLSVASTSVFPSGASANPTFTLMLFTLRLADYLATSYRW